MTKNFLFLLTICTFILSVSTIETKSLKRRSIVQKIAQNVGKYFDDLLPDVDKNVQTKGDECDTMDEIEDYFVKVYSSNDTDNISSSDLDDLISYQVTKGRSKTAQEKTKKFKCSRSTCFQSDDILKMLNLSAITKENIPEICPILLYNLELDACVLSKEQGHLDRRFVWIIGLSFTTIATLFSWIGTLALPFMGKPLYKHMLTGIISLAFGCVLSNSLLNFIPRGDGFDTLSLERPNTTFFFKHVVILSVICFLFNFERAMKLVAFYKKEQSEKRKRRELEDAEKLNEDKKSEKKKNLDNNIKLLSYKLTSKDECTDVNETNKEDEMKSELKHASSIPLSDIHFLGVQPLNEIIDNASVEIVKPSGRICCTSVTDGLTKVRPIAWMSCCSDGISNFIDGLSIGASINQGFTAGLTVAIPVWMANCPQELGDYALLSRAGMTPFQALFYNYLSALGAYAGFAVGCIAGESLLVARWIFAVSGATTMYMSLAVLLPEIIREFEESEPFFEKVKITIIQISGLIIGYSVLALLNVYEEEISL